MGLFDFFKRKKKPAPKTGKEKEPVKTIEEEVQEEVKEEPTEEEVLVEEPEIKEEDLQITEEEEQQKQLELEEERKKKEQEEQLKLEEEKKKEEEDERKKQLRLEEEKKQKEEQERQKQLELEEEREKQEQEEQLSLEKEKKKKEEDERKEQLRLQEEKKQKEEQEEVAAPPEKEEAPLPPPTEPIEKPKTLDEGIKKTKEGFFSKIGKAILGKSKISEADLDDLEEALIAADVGIDTTINIIDRLEERVAKDKFLNTSELNRILKEEITPLLTSEDNAVSGFEIPDMDTPYIIMVVGVNGVGKTSTIGKLAHKFKQKGKQVMLGAADTYRAAAIEQLSIWAERNDVPCVKQDMGSDPGAVAYDTVSSAIAKNMDIAIIDTAGRLHNKKYLMEELAKIKRVMQKVIPDAPHEILLILDATTGQNAISQAKEFLEVTDVNAIALTKLDGTAKGGVVIGISNQFKMPIKYIGVGEKIDDLRIFNKEEFIDSLFK